ncbi:MAG TPA: 4-hydroxy-tetrahydrodipicolinate reductase [Alphaproteobacteria bacterium]|nr:4-hydroxy-tetrahydrodipicolinate reductase [Alphaproteobacteria bacterium]
MKIGITGCAGRMGRMLMAEATGRDGVELAGGVERPGHDAVGRDLGLLAGGEPIGVKVTSDPQALFELAAAVIDFTTPENTVANAEIAAATGRPLIIGTTGLEAEHMAAIDRAAAKTVIVQAANMALGVNLLLGLVRRVSKVLDTDYDIEIVEMHHRHKVDAPSGTALALGRAAAAGRGVEFEDVAMRGRDGLTGARRPGDIGFASLRGGDVAGDHTVIFAGPGERIELTHRAADRSIFARGAVSAALWCAGRPPGRYSMTDVLGLD